MKVYVMTKANLFQPEVYVGVKKSKKEATKTLRDLYPHMKSDDSGNSFVSDSSKQPLLLFIHEEEI